jgi:putative endonuclease
VKKAEFPPRRTEPDSPGLDPAIQGHRHCFMKTYYVYLLASQRNGTLYIGVTSDLVRRIYEHREGVVEGFTKRYGVKHLVYFEEFSDVYLGIQREKTLKKWPRAWKLDLIEKSNPQWRDLYEEII